MRRIILLAVVLLFVFSAVSQNEKQRFRVVGYNVENYFDTVDDPDTNDEEYLPGGYRGWNMTKYRHKQEMISKAIVAMSEDWEPPAIVSLSEIESRLAMLDLTQKSPLKNLGYKFVHYESPDSRGIDIAIMYQPHRFKPFFDDKIEVSNFRTRDILHVAGTVVSGDTLHIFAVHFPSRWGGELESEARRLEVAGILREKIDSLFTNANNPNIIIMGDLNDNPDNASVREGLRAHPPRGEYEGKELYNLAYPFHERNIGSHKFQGEWSMIDHIMVSGNMLSPDNGISTRPEDFKIFDADFLLEPDEQYLGKKPFRSYIGMKYNAGYSDHLPVFVDLWF